MKISVRIAAAAVVFVFAQSASADLAGDLGALKGYTIIDSTNVERWMDSDGEKGGDSFEGCEIGRIIMFTNGKRLICQTFNYTYSYHPKAVILSNRSSYKMIVENHIYDMKN